MNIFHVILAVGAGFYILTCLAFIDIARKDFGSLGIKVLWGFIAFIPFIGVVIYIIFGFRKGKVIRPQIPES
jgi:phospholipase D-like protein